MIIQLKYISILSLSLGILMAPGCAEGRDKNEGTTEEPQSSVGITFEQDQQSRTTGTEPAGDTVGVNAKTGINDQVGPTGTQGPDDNYPENPAY